jgi:microcystin-dependent protein
MKRSLKLLLVLCTLFVFENTSFSQDGMIGEVRLFAGNFAPRGWAICDGSLMSISENTALFSILGTMYGGDGRTTFALPDLRGRVPVGVGTGPGLENIKLGEKNGGTEVEGQQGGNSKTITEQPSLGMNYIICTRGIFPSRN